MRSVQHSRFFKTFLGAICNLFQLRGIGLWYMNGKIWSWIRILWINTLTISNIQGVLEVQRWLSFRGILTCASKISALTYLFLFDYPVQLASSLSHANNRMQNIVSYFFIRLCDLPLISYKNDMTNCWPAYENGCADLLILC